MIKSDTELINLLSRMHADSWRGAYRGVYPDGFLDNEADAQRVKFWTRRLPALRLLSAELFLATVNQQPAGFLCIEVDQAAPSSAFIDNLHVLPAFQRYGIATALVERAATWACQRRLQSMWLFVLEANTEAQRFYARNGWQTVGREMHDLANGGEAPVLRLVKSLVAVTEPKSRSRKSRA